jgi:hypothetical protein
MKPPHIINKFDTGKINGMVDIIEYKIGLKIPRITGEDQLKNMFEDISKKMKISLNINVSKNDIYGLNKNFQKIFEVI